jgi:hypothetical protein
MKKSVSVPRHTFWGGASEESMGLGFFNLRVFQPRNTIGEGVRMLMYMG